MVGHAVLGRHKAIIGDVEWAGRMGGGVVDTTGTGGFEDLVDE
jgi:hypothetical protein